MMLTDLEFEKAMTCKRRLWLHSHAPNALQKDEHIDDFSAEKKRILQLNSLIGRYSDLYDLHEETCEQDVSLFMLDELSCTIDIVQRCSYQSLRDAKYTLYVFEHSILDSNSISYRAAFQYYLFTKLHPECDVQMRLVYRDQWGEMHYRWITEEVEAMLPSMPRLIAIAKEIKSKQKQPVVWCNKYCSPRCEYLDYCQQQQDGTSRIRLSKSSYVRSIQCNKMLWLDRHIPNKKVIPDDVQKRLAEGKAFGEKAKGMFGEYVDVTSYTQDGLIDCDTMIERTKQEIAKGTAVICEAAFASDGLYCAVDILCKEEDDVDRQPTYSIYEVKDVAEVDPYFYNDVTFQYIVASHSIKINHICIVTHGENDKPKIKDVTRFVKSHMSLTFHCIDVAKLSAVAKTEPNIPCGAQCEKPYRCWYWDYCHNGEEK